MKNGLEFRQNYKIWFTKFRKDSAFYDSRTDPRVASWQLTYDFGSPQRKYGENLKIGQKHGLGPRRFPQMKIFKNYSKISKITQRQI